MDERPPQPPEGRLIADAMKRSGLSGRKAAALAGISEGRFRQIVNGYQVVRAGVYVPVEGPPDTVARLAQTVGVTPEQLDEAGRADAAEELRALPAERDPAALPSLEQIAERQRELEARDLAREQRDRAREKRAQRLEAGVATMLEQLRAVLGDEAADRIQRDLDERRGEDDERRSEAG